MNNKNTSEPIDDFAANLAKHIVDELQKEGCSLDDLPAQFADRWSKYREALTIMMQRAKDAAQGIGEFYAHDEVFNQPEN